MATLATLSAWRETLLRLRAQGTRRVRDQNGEEVEFRSDAELRSALAAVDSEIAVASRGLPITSIRFRTSKGL